MSLALALHGSPYYIGMAVLLVLFFIALKQINISLQSIFVDALRRAKARVRACRSSSIPP